MRYLTFILMMCICFNTTSALSSEGFVEDGSGFLETAIFAGGCFWCMEKPFDEIPGVRETLSGYIGGTTKNPTYKEVSSGKTGHTEAIKVVFDPKQVSYSQLLSIFWRNIDPFNDKGQFCDLGNQYRSGIFYTNNQQRQEAEDSLSKLQRELAAYDQAVVTEISAASTFYKAEDYHQDYYIKNPLRYKYYRYRCGRDERLQVIWGN